MVCKNCGAELQDDSIFCANCGAAQNENNIAKIDNSDNIHRTKKIKKLLIVIAIVMACVVLVVFSIIAYRIYSINSSKKTVINYCEAIKNFDFVEMSKYRDSDFDEEEFLSWEETLEDSDAEKVLYDFFKTNVSNIEYTVGNVNIFDKDWDRITFSVRFEYNDAYDLLEKAFYDIMEALIYNEYYSEEEMESESVEILRETLKVDRTDRDEKTFEFTCVRNDKGNNPRYIIKEVSDGLEYIITGNLEEVMGLEDNISLDDKQEKSEENNVESLYPDGMIVSNEYIKPLEIAGSYSGKYPNSSAEVNSFSYPEDDITVGNVELFVGGNASAMASDYISGELQIVDKNLYSVFNEYDERTILIGVDYNNDRDCISFDLYINDNYRETYYMDYQYMS